MIPSWLIFAVFAGLASNLYNFLNRYILSRENDSTAFGWLTELVRLLIAFAVLPFDFFIAPGFNPLLVIFALGAVEFVSIFIFMKMHAFSHLSISTIISRMRLIWIPLIAFLFLGEKLKAAEYLGIAVLFFGLSVAVSPRRIFLDRGISYAYLSSVVVAVLSIVMKLASPLMSSSYVLIGMSFLTVAVYPFILKDGLKRIIKISGRRLPLKIMASASNVVSMYLYVYALKIGDVSKVTAIYQGMMVVSILAGIVLLKEKQDIIKKLLGAAITLGGVMLLTFL